MMGAPLCRYCGQKLKKQTRHIDIRPGDPDPVVWGPQKEPVLEIVRRKSIFNGKWISISVWLGKWGAYGDGFFCNMRHAQAWAVNEMRRRMAKS